MNNTYSHDESRRIEIAADAAVSVQVSIGTTIQCVRGRVWLTQEGDSRDHAFPAGVSFSVDTPGRAVLTALGGPSVVLVTRDKRPAFVPGTLRIDSIEAITRTARQMQASYLSRAISKLFAWS